MKSLEELITLNENLRKVVINKVIAKKTIIQRPGDIITKGYYVKKGLLRSYFIDEKGKEYTFLFAPEDWMISDIESSIYNTPGTLFIETLEDSEVVIIDRKAFQEMQSNSKSLNIELTKLLNRVATLQKRVIMLMSSSAIDRYNHFIETYPQLIHRVPKKMIASYLGITQETLSKIRSKQLKN